MKETVKYLRERKKIQQEKEDCKKLSGTEI